MQTNLSNAAVQVPTDRLSEFYTMLAGLFESVQPETNKLTEWECSDGEIAKKVYESLSPIAREIYESLFNWAPTGLTVDDLAESTKKKPSQIRGALSWPSTHAKSFGKVPIHCQMEDGKNIFVTEKVAQIFKDALGRS
jgi:hypothetical protein